MTILQEPAVSYMEPLAHHSHSLRIDYPSIPRELKLIQISLINTEQRQLSDTRFLFQLTLPNKPMNENTLQDFESPATGNGIFDFPPAAARFLILYFYPQGQYPVCTTKKRTNSCGDLYPEFTETGCLIAGVSRDSIKSHENFKTKQGSALSVIERHR